MPVLAGLALLVSVGQMLAQTTRQVKAKPPPSRAADAGDLEALAKFHARLVQLETDKTGKFGRLNVLQIGDSHTAADHFTGRLRNLLQARFGNGGRGFLPPGAPHAWYKPYQVSVTQSAGWKTLSSNKTTPDAAQFGLSGYLAEANAAGETITIDVKAGVDTLAVGYRWRPDGGKFEIVADGTPMGAIETRFAGDGPKEVWQSISGLGGRGADHPWRLEIRTLGDGPVDIADFSLWRTKGIRFSNLGFIGAQVSIMARWHWPAVREQLAALDPALIILAFGTNEGHAPVGNIEARYARQLEERLIALKAAAPNASIVVVGTPDANRYPKFCLPPPAQVLQPDVPASGGPGAGAAHAPAEAAPATPPPPDLTPISKSRVAKPAPPPPPEPPADAVCRPLDLNERATYEQLLADKDRRLCRWHTLPAIPVVRAIQRDVAARQGALFFDWFALFESECGADRWFRQGLAHKDRVHFKQAGYWLAADKLHARLMAGYPPPKR